MTGCSHQYGPHHMYVVRTHWGDVGLLWSGAVLGFTDVDALTISMAKSAEGQIPLAIAVRAIAIGVLSNTVLKLFLGATLGGARFRRLSATWCWRRARWREAAILASALFALTNGAASMTSFSAPATVDRIWTSRPRPAMAPRTFRGSQLVAGVRLPAGQARLGE